MGATGTSTAAQDATRRHLLRRTTYGLTPGLLTAVPVTNTRAWLEAQLRPATVKDPVADALRARFPRLGWSIPTVSAKIESNQVNSWDVMVDLSTLAVARAVWSNRQLLEVMVDFWSNLLNITCPSSEVAASRARFDADVIRRYAFGRFADLLQAATTHPAMLTYLNNADSTSEAPNENLGRELLELHSVGIDAGYSEADVKASARILTGLSIDWSTGAFVYRPDYHHVGPLRVMGFRHPNAAADGRAVVAAYTAYLAAHPATAHRLARRLAVHFVSDDPPAALVNRLAATYRASGTSIVPVLRQLFTSPEFLAAPDTKIRRPYEAFVASMRGLGITPPAKGTQPLLEMFWVTNTLGHQPLAWPMPNGYPDIASAWQSSSGTLARWNANLSLVGGWWPHGLGYPKLKTLLPKPLPTTYAVLLNALANRVRSRSLTVVERDAICGYLGVSPTARVRADAEAVTWRLTSVIGLLLDSPVQMLR
jgi:Protein of unknown function (DUF1800)